MRSRLFNPEGFLWKPLGWLGDLVLFSLLWTVCSLPVLTLGPATAALYDAVSHTFRKQELDGFARFLRTFRAELKTGVAATALWGVPLAGLIWAYSAYVRSGHGSLTAAAAFLVILGLAAGLTAWVFPLLSRFAFDVKTLSLTALRLGLGRLPVTAILAVTAYGALWLCSRLLYFPVMVVPALLMLLWSFPLEREFRRYGG
ncbi:MAG: DUF624 domain-containing protein [Oscillospiraceae bacterium]|nr:DUF624 domain-containing protein [Oscillospiraceae bacterium]